MRVNPPTVLTSPAAKTRAKLARSPGFEPDAKLVDIIRSFNADMPVSKNDPCGMFYPVNKGEPRTYEAIKESLAAKCASRIKLQTKRLDSKNINLSRIAEIAERIAEEAGSLNASLELARLDAVAAKLCNKLTELAKQFVANSCNAEDEYWAFLQQHVHDDEGSDNTVCIGEIYTGKYQTCLFHEAALKAWDVAIG
jgi:hypothetical protein